MRTKYSPIQKTAWPQDQLIIPKGFGTMPEVDATNAVRVKQEYFCMAGQVSLWDMHTTAQIIINAPQDGDFWITSAVCLCWSTIDGVFLDVNTYFYITVTDILNGFDLFQPYIDYPMLKPVIPSGTLAGAANPIAQGVNGVQDFTQPYPLLRNGGLKIRTTADPQTISSGITLTGINVYFAFHGWKEYANAAV